MAKHDLKVGDRMWNKGVSKSGNQYKYGTVIGVSCDGNVDVRYDDGQTGWSCASEVNIHYKKVSKKTIMEQINAYAKRLLDADTKTLISAGYLDKELELSSEGRKALNVIVFEKFRAELLASAQERIEEIKAEEE